MRRRGATEHPWAYLRKSQEGLRTDCSQEGLDLTRHLGKDAATGSGYVVSVSFGEMAPTLDLVIIAVGRGDYLTSRTAASAHPPPR